ncbi:hypothetical protein S40293_11109 [Stachybotrys chartarum IBT 40293]|nr:hypothetical protein S40293_11109 [Stachybotrys chartarum IBT 40293]
MCVVKLKGHKLEYSFMMAHVAIFQWVARTEALRSKEQIGRKPQTRPPLMQPLEYPFDGAFWVPAQPRTTRDDPPLPPFDSSGKNVLFSSESFTSSAAPNPALRLARYRQMTRNNALFLPAGRAIRRSSLAVCQKTEPAAWDVAWTSSGMFAFACMHHPSHRADTQ